MIQQDLVDDHVVSKEPNEMSYNERFVYKKTDCRATKWTGFWFRVRSTIDIPICVILGVKKSRVNDQFLYNGSF